MRRYDFVCKNCKKRYVGCHSNCEDYRMDLNNYNELEEPRKEIARRENLRLSYDYKVAMRIERLKKRRIS